MDPGLHRIIGVVKTALEGEGIRVRRAVLFGSHARGTPSESSDVDIAIISDDFEGMNLRERLERIGLALARARVLDPVEIRAYTEAEYQSNGRGTFVGDEVRGKGVEVT